MVYIPQQQQQQSKSGAANSIAGNGTGGKLYEVPPAEAGPATAQLHQHSKDLAGRVAQVVADMIIDVSESNGVNSNQASIHYLKLRMERMKWEHQQEISEMKHNNGKALG